MPIMSCTRNGRKGYKYGATGTCYIGPQGRALAERQAKAIEASRSRKK